MTPEDRIVRLAVVGCGDVAWRYLDGLSRLKNAGAAVTVLCDADAGRLESTAARFGIGVVHDAVEDVLTGGSVDALLNLTPTPVHAAVTRAALEHGTHVYSEKPLATTHDEGRALARLAEESDAVLLCAPATVVFPIWRMVRRLLDEGAIGQPHAMRARFEMPPLPWRRHQTGATWFVAPEVGPLRDVGIYALHGMLDLFGSPTQVTCQAAALLEGDAAAADAMSVAMKFEGGGFATLDTGFFVHASTMPWAEIYGERGTIAIAMRDKRAPLRVCAIEHHGDSPAWREISGDAIARDLDCDTTGSDDWFDYMAGVEEFVDVIRTRRDSPLSARHACAVLDVIDRAYAGAANGGRA